MNNPATIFIVDDDETTRINLQVVLQTAGYAVAAYESCRSFIENFQRPENACLILDLHLQDMGAWEPAAFLNRRGADIPVVLMTRTGDPVLQSQLSCTGSIALLEKPLDSDLLLKTINAIFR